MSSAAVAIAQKWYSPSVSVWHRVSRKVSPYSGELPEDFELPDFDSSIPENANLPPDTPPPGYMSEVSTEKLRLWNTGGIGGEGRDTHLYEMYNNPFFRRSIALTGLLSIIRNRICCHRRGLKHRRRHRQHPATRTPSHRRTRCKITICTLR